MPFSSTSNVYFRFAEVESSYFIVFVGFMNFLANLTFVSFLLCFVSQKKRSNVWPGHTQTLETLWHRTPWACLRNAYAFCGMSYEQSLACSPALCQVDFRPPVRVGYLSFYCVVEECPNNWANYFILINIFRCVFNLSDCFVLSVLFVGIFGHKVIILDLR